jgi:hypothetical protein
MAIFCLQPVNCLDVSSLPSGEVLYTLPGERLIIGQGKSIDLAKGIGEGKNKNQETKTRKQVTRYKKQET